MLAYNFKGVFLCWQACLRRNAFQLAKDSKKFHEDALSYV